MFWKSKLADVVLFAGLAIAGAIALGVDFGAAYPPGDGGMFYAICRQLEATHFVYPTTIDYNGSHIPFAYSPGAFYSVAAIGSIMHLPIGNAMNLWVCTWALLLGPVAYWAGYAIFGTRVPALVAAFFVVLEPHAIEDLGMGGGITRSPGMCFLMLACGAIWQLKTRWSRRNVAIASLASAASGWMHMEYFLLLIISGFIIILSTRLALRRVMVLVGCIVAFLAPWPILVIANGALPAVRVALATSHGAQAPSPELIFWSMLGNPAESIITAIGLTALVITTYRRDFIWIIWALFVAVIDSRAGARVDHFVVGLAVGAVVVSLEKRFGKQVWSPSVIVAAILLAIVGTENTSALANETVRISPDDVADMHWIRAHSPLNAGVIVAYADAGSFDANHDQTYEWLPALAERYSATAYEGLEWVDLPQYHRMWNGYQYIQSYCGHIGVSCLQRFADARFGPSRPVYIYLPEHSEYAGLLRQNIASSGSFEAVHRSFASTIFEERHALKRNHLTI